MLCSRDFMNRTKYNNETLEQLWMSVLSDTHETICSCNFPFAHLLALIFPLGHTDRKLTIEQILKRDYKEKCLSGGTAGDAPGFTTKEDIKQEGTPELAVEGFPEENIDALLAEAAADVEEGTR